MTTLSTTSKKMIKDAIEFLNVNRRPITVSIEGEGTLFLSKIVKVDHGDLFSSGTSERLVIEWLYPEKGRDLIQSGSPIKVRFSLGKSECEFTSYYITESRESKYLGHMITYPDSIIVVDRRRKKRNAIGVEDRPLFSHAKLTTKMGESYDLRILDVSEKGVGILVGQELSGLLEHIAIGDRLELELYASWTIVKVDGTVRHKSAIREGEYTGFHLMGVDLAERLEYYV